MPFLVIFATCLLIALKLTGAIFWGWAAVLAPLWVFLILMVVYLMLESL